MSGVTRRSNSWEAGWGRQTTKRRTKYWPSRRLTRLQVAVNVREYIHEQRGTYSIELLLTTAGHFFSGFSKTHSAPESWQRRHGAYEKRVVIHRRQRHCGSSSTLGGGRLETGGLSTVEHRRRRADRRGGPRVLTGHCAARLGGRSYLLLLRIGSCPCDTPCTLERRVWACLPEPLHCCPRPRRRRRRRRRGSAAVNCGRLDAHSRRTPFGVWRAGSRSTAAGTP
jgi:hypothetical protein